MDTTRFDYTKMAHMSESFHKLSNSLTTTVSNRIRAAPWALSTTLLNNRGCMWVYSQWEGCLTHQYPTIPLFLGGQLIFPETVVVGCTNELNSILPSTTFSLDSAEAGVAEQEGTTVFTSLLPPKYLPMKMVCNVLAGRHSWNTHNINEHDIFILHK